MTIHTTVPVEKDAAETVRDALRIAQSNYKRATVKHSKIDETIETAEARLATRQNDLEGYKHADDDAALAASKILLKGGDLKLPEKTTKVLADRDALKDEIRLLETGLVSLNEQLKEAYARKREAYEALDAAGSEVIREEASLPLSSRLATIREEGRQIVSKLRALESASITRTKPGEFYISHRDFLGQLGTQLLAQEPQRLDVNSVALARLIEQWHTSLLSNVNAELSETTKA